MRHARDVHVTPAFHCTCDSSCFMVLLGRRKSEAARVTIFVDCELKFQGPRDLNLSAHERASNEDQGCGVNRFGRVSRVERPTPSQIYCFRQVQWLRSRGRTKAPCHWPDAIFKHLVQLLCPDMSHPDMLTFHCEGVVPEAAIVSCPEHGRNCSDAWACQWEGLHTATEPSVVELSPSSQQGSLRRLGCGSVDAVVQLLERCCLRFSRRGWCQCQRGVCRNVGPDRWLVSPSSGSRGSRSCTVCSIPHWPIRCGSIGRRLHHQPIIEPGTICPIIQGTPWSHHQRGILTCPEHADLEPKD